MVATELPEAVPAIEPPAILRKPAPIFVGPSEADKLTVTEFERNTPPIALPVKSSSDLPPSPATDPGAPSQRSWAAKSIPPSSSAPEAPPTSYQPPPRSQAPAQEAANAPASTTDLKGRLHAADPTADTAPRAAVGETQIEQTASPSTLFSPPAKSGTGATDPAPSIKVGTHAAQILPTLITLAKSALGSEQMTVRLHPAELGMVQVRIERAASGAAHIELTADDPKTLQALQRDQSALHRALDGAGIPAAGRTLTFHAVQPPSASVSSGSTGAASASGQHPSSGRGANGNPDAARFAGGGRGSYSAWQTTRRSGGRPSSANATTASTTPRIYRAGLDITAWALKGNSFHVWNHFSPGHGKHYFYGVYDRAGRHYGLG
jgi:Flagellar hook-length control protein FliK